MFKQSSAAVKYLIVIQWIDIYPVDPGGEQYPTFEQVVSRVWSGVDELMLQSERNKLLLTRLS